jgi:cytochrome c oxidase subunit I+III
MTPTDLPNPADRLAATWRDPSGAYGWLCHVDHKSLGRRYITTAFAFFLAGGVMAALMRWQLATPESGRLSADVYNQLFSTHGTTMMFLFAVPMMQGLGIYLVPLMVGARAIAFPRLVAFSYWMFLFGGIFLMVSLTWGVGPDAGWFAYTPLSESPFTPTKRADVWAQLITFTEVAGLAVAISLITTVFKLRTPGMTLDRIPIFVWAEVVISFMVIFAMPAVMVSSTALILDRLVNTHFFQANQGGDPLLWQHLFWFFGHPEVYIIFLPGTAIVSTIISTAASRPIFGYLIVVLSLVATAFMGFGLWVHHMFATGLPQLGESFFTAASMMIAIPTGAQFFCWIATLWNGRLRFSVPFLWIIGFFFVFLIGGLSGVMVASVPFDLQAHDTFFVVAHFHYVLIGGAVFPLFGGLYYWFPKITGWRLDDRLGVIAFGLFFVGFNLTFFPMHILGLRGMPRRVYTYQPGLGFDTLNLLATAGAAVMASAVLVMLFDMVRCRWRARAAAENPWGAPTLEWATSSPPPAYNFAAPLVVSSAEPLWEPGPLTEVTGLKTDQREVLVTFAMDARPDHRTTMPEPSLWPFLTALVTTAFFITSIFTPWAVVWFAAPMFLVMVGWFWPKPHEPFGTRRWPFHGRQLPKPAEAYRPEVAV